MIANTSIFILGSLDGHLRYNPNPIILWVDAHADISKFG